MKGSKKMLTGLLIAGLAGAQPISAYADTVTVMLDAGHGGSDPGAVGVNGLYEKTVNLDVVLRLKDELVNRGYEVYLTRDTDIFLSLAQRVAIKDTLMPDLFVSVHANAHTNSAINGSLVLYYDKNYPQASYPASEAMAELTPESKRLAQLVQSHMVEEAGTVDRGLVPSAVYVARMGSVPSILVETAFLSNWQDATLLNDSGFRQKLAVGIANGIEAYMPPEKEADAFSDVSASHWAYEAIAKLAAMGIVQGEYGQYYPSRALTRGEFVAMLERQFPFPDLSGTENGCAQEDSEAPTVTQSIYEASCSESAVIPSAQPDPSDLSPTHWAYSSLKKALEAGVLSGYADGTVQPDRTLTRGEAAVLIDRIIWPNSSQTTTGAWFSDVPAGLWSAAAINRLKEKGIIEGVTSSTFAPEEPITRAEMAALLARLIH